MKKTKKSLVILLLVFSLLPLRVFAHDRTPYNWFVQNNDNHTPPVLHTNFAFAEKYNFYYLDKKAESDDKVIYLTFDAGYENGNVEKVLDALDKHGVKGTFFILENLIRRNPELVKRMVDQGHTVCNHTATHPDMSTITDITLFEKQLTRLEKAYTELTGKEMPKIYRPPQGRFSEENLAFADQLGYKTLLWSFAYADWDNAKQPDPNRALDKILSHLHCGEVMLLHPTSATNAEIMDRLLTEIEKEGYRIGCIEELFA
ncbi:MAG: polysaccharide deacetylase family protein [Clostridia bacterium]|nr:polysaccharide deacetylase family protein [Clostridia bacterium]